MAFGSASFVLIAAALFIIFRQRTQNKRQQTITETIAKTELKEQERISRDLHDSVGAMLASVNHQLAHINIVELKEQQQLKNAQEQLQKTAQETRRIAHNMLPKELTEFGLVSTIESSVDALNASGQLQIDFVHFGLDARLDPVKELHVYRMVQELLQNMLKHAQATKATLQLTRHKKALNILAEDNGIGFNNTAGTEGAGLKNIQNRVQFLKGNLLIDSKKNSGTTLTINIPIL